MLKVKFDARNFLDRPAIKKALGKAEARMLNRIGGVVRKIARRSIRRRKKVSAPGSPPSARSDDMKKIVYQADIKRGRVEIGLIPYDGSELPRLLEKGGSHTQRRRGKKPRRVHYRARPFMAPAHKTARRKGLILKATKGTFRG